MAARDTPTASMTRGTTYAGSRTLATMLAAASTPAPLKMSAFTSERQGGEGGNEGAARDQSARAAQVQAIPTNTTAQTAVSTAHSEAVNRALTTFTTSEAATTAAPTARRLPAPEATELMYVTLLSLTTAATETRPANSHAHTFTASRR